MRQCATGAKDLLNRNSDRLGYFLGKISVFLSKTLENFLAAYGVSKINTLHVVLLHPGSPRRGNSPVMIDYFCSQYV